MDFNQLKDLKSTWGENRTIVPEWVEGQSFYVVSDELLKQLINEINESRLLREQIAREIEEHGNSWLGPNGDGMVLHSKESAAIYAAIARGNHVNLPLG